MKKESDNRMEMSRRGFLKAAALTGAALCVSPALEKVQAAERRGGTLRVPGVGESAGGRESRQ